MKLGGISPPSEGFQLRLNTIGLNEISISLAVQFFGLSVWRRVSNDICLVKLIKKSFVCSAKLDMSDITREVPGNTVTYIYIHIHASQSWVCLF